MSSLLHVVTKLVRTAAVRPPLSLPKKSQFLRLWKAFLKRNYVQEWIMFSTYGRTDGYGSRWIRQEIFSP